MVCKLKYLAFRFHSCPRSISLKIHEFSPSRNRSLQGKVALPCPTRHSPIPVTMVLFVKFHAGNRGCNFQLEKAAVACVKKWDLNPTRTDLGGFSHQDYHGIVAMTPKILQQKKETHVINTMILCSRSPSNTFHKSSAQCTGAGASWLAHRNEGGGLRCLEVFTPAAFDLTTLEFRATKRSRTSGPAQGQSNHTTLSGIAGKQSCQSPPAPWFC